MSRRRSGNGQNQQNQQRERKPKAARRQWVIEPRLVDQESGNVELDRAEVAQALAELEPLGHYLGGSFIVTPLRVKVEDSLGGEAYRVIAWHVEHEPFVPALNLPSESPTPAAFSGEQFDEEGLEALGRELGSDVPGLDLEPQMVHAGDEEDAGPELAGVDPRLAVEPVPESERPVEVGTEEEAASIVGAS